MRAVDPTAAMSTPKKSGIRWKRIVLAAVLSELTVIALLLAVIAIHRFVIAPGQTAAQNDEFAEAAGYYFAPPAAGVATFLFAFWVARRLDSHFVINGVLVGAVGTLLMLGFVFGAKPEDRLMYVLSYVLRIAAGYCGGLVAQKMKKV